MRLFKRNQTQRNQQLSDDELQRTQVLNLQAFKETARIEKLSSKKPAIILAVIGVLSISLGLSFPAIQSLSTRQNAEKNQQKTLERRQSEEKIKKVVEEEMICTHQDLNKPNGTDGGVWWLDSDGRVNSNYSGIEGLPYSETSIE